MFLTKVKVLSLEISNSDSVGVNFDVIKARWLEMNVTTVSESLSGGATARGVFGCRTNSRRNLQSHSTSTISYRANT